MELVKVTTVFFTIIAIELIYFWLAKRFNIVDKPNHRSSHSMVVIRGGGIIFPLAIVISALFFKFQYPYFFLGLICVALISFIDDLKTISGRIRLGIHLLAAILMLYQLGVESFSMYALLALLVVIGTINIINFMDGINALTGFYALIALITLCIINQNILFTDSNYIITVILAVLVFLIFNARVKAKCFAGDVGSVSIAFILIFFLLQLILKTGNPAWLLLFMVYYLDAFTTIAFRLIRKENITQAHRSHFYQYLANERKMPHLLVAVLYGLTQLLINIALVKIPDISVMKFIFIGLVGLIIFLSIRFFTEGSKRLFAK